MRLTTKSQYAVRALVALALISEDAPVTLRQISEVEDISLHYLEQLFSKLRKGKVVVSVKGPGGGYILARPARDIAVGTILELVEEPMTPVSCIVDGNDSCRRYDICRTRSLWAELGNKIKDYLDSVSIHDLCEQSIFSEKGIK